MAWFGTGMQSRLILAVLIAFFPMVINTLSGLLGTSTWGEGKGDGCAFCRIPEMTDEEGLIVARGETVYAVLNLYPYNAGHLMVVPYRHVAPYVDLADDETAEFADYTKRCVRALVEAAGAQGFNIGMNQGSVAGAGIAEHLHQHVVPRWGGDTNFMPVVGRTKVLPQLLSETRDLLAKAWSSP